MVKLNIIGRTCIFLVNGLLKSIGNLSVYFSHAFAVSSFSSWVLSPALDKRCWQLKMRIKLLLIVCALLPRFQSLIEKPNALMLPMRQKYMDEKMHHVECACRDPLKGAVLEWQAVNLHLFFQTLRKKMTSLFVQSWRISVIKVWSLVMYNYI